MSKNNDKRNTNNGSIRGKILPQARAKAEVEAWAVAKLEASRPVPLAGLGLSFLRSTQDHVQWGLLNDLQHGPRFRWVVMAEFT